MTEKKRIEWTSEVFDALCKHFKEPGTYRHLIHDKLGFDESAYVDLMGGLTVSNCATELQLAEESKQALMAAAVDLIAHWDTPAWDFNKPSTASKINALREAIDKTAENDKFTSGV